MFMPEDISKEEADNRFYKYQLKYLVFGYTINNDGFMEYISVACVTEEAMKRNCDKLVSYRVFNLQEIK